MRRNRRKLALWVLGAPVMAAGCIYTDGIAPVNKRPEAVIEMVTPEPIHVGTEVVFSGEQSKDPEGHLAGYQWSIECEVMGQGPVYENCLGRPRCDESTTEPLCCFVPRAKTTCTVSLVVTDDRGVHSEPVQRSVGVVNRSPTAVIGVDSPTTDKGHFVVGQDVWLHALGSRDPDPGDILSFEWKATTRPPGSTSAFRLETFDVHKAPTNSPQAAVYCLVVPDFPGSYEVSLTVSDGDATDMAVQHLEVDEDGPPCIEDTNPDWHSEVLVFEADQKHRIEVLRVADDLDWYPPGRELTFHWSIRTDPAVGFVPVTGWNEPYLDLPAWRYQPGDHVQVRLLVEDRTNRDLSPCVEDDKVCSLVAGCAQWVTWTIDYR